MIRDGAIAGLLQRHMGEVPEPDEEGVWSVVVDDRLPVFLRSMDESEAIFVSAGVGSLADDHAPAMLRHLLAANPYWHAHTGFCLGLVPGTGSVLLTGLIAQGGTDDSLDGWFQDFIQAAFSWRDELRHLAAGEEAEPAVETAAETAAEVAAEVADGPHVEPSHLQDFV